MLSLAAAESDGLDGTSLKYLLKLALKEREEEEERKRLARSDLTSLLSVPKEHRTADQERRITAASRFLTVADRRKRKKRRKGSSLGPLLFDPLVVCGYDAVGKGSALALGCLVRSVPFGCRQA